MAGTKVIDAETNRPFDAIFVDEAQDINLVGVGGCGDVRGQSAGQET